MAILIAVCNNLVTLLANVMVDILENVSIAHVLLLLFLRLYLIQNPMRRGGLLRFQKTLLIATWIGPIILKLPVIYFVFIEQHGYDIGIFGMVYGIERPLNIYWNIQFHISSTLSVLLIIIMYGLMIFTIKNKRRENRQMLNQNKSTEQNANDRKTTLIITRLVVVVILCYLPFVIQRSKEYYDNVLLFPFFDHESVCRVYLDFTNEVM